MVKKNQTSAGDNNEGRKYNKYAVDPKEFCRIWEESQTVHEVAKKTGMTPAIASARASTYRDMGAPPQEDETKLRFGTAD
jgi:hypothetical protein